MLVDLYRKGPKAAFVYVWNTYTHMVVKSWKFKILRVSECVLFFFQIRPHFYALRPVFSSLIQRHQVEGK